MTAKGWREAETIRLVQALGEWIQHINDIVVQWKRIGGGGVLGIVEARRRHEAFPDRDCT